MEAGFWDDNSGGVITVLKGLVMLWILNLIRQNAGGDGNENEDIITSTIKKGLNIGSEQTPVEIQEEEAEPQVQVLDQLTENELSLLKMVNNARNERGVQSLEIDLRLVEVAREKAEDIVTNKYFDHISPTYGSPFDMMKESNIGYLLAGENLAEARTVSRGFQELMNSPEHSRNILEPKYDKVGIGIVEGGSYGLTIVQEFIDSPVIQE